MKIFYYGRGMIQLPLMAAGLHLGLLQAAPPPSPGQIFALPGFHRSGPRDLARVQAVGVDGQGAQVLVFSGASVAPHILRAVAGAVHVFGGEAVIMGDAGSSMNWPLRAGGLASQLLHRPTLQSLVGRGARQALPSLAQLVAGVRRCQGAPAGDPSPAGMARGVSYLPAPPRPASAAGTRQRKVIYYCYGGTHSSVLAAAIHLGVLGEAARPSPEEIMELPLFDRVDRQVMGKPFFCGHDQAGREVYVLGTGKYRAQVSGLIKSLVSSCYPQEPAPCLINTLTAVNGRTRVGGFASRRLGQVWGRRAAARGLWETYEQLVDLVQLHRAALGGRVIRGEGASSKGPVTAAGRGAVAGDPLP